MNINFCPIAPVSYLPYVAHYPVHLLLAHLVEENVDYRAFYTKLKRDNPNVYYHMDNSAFEMFKRGQPMYETSKLLQMAELVNADSIVMSDYPKEDYRKTIDTADKLIPQFKSEGFDTFFCPQSKLGDLNGLMTSFDWALHNPNVDWIGVSILACPIALGINETKHGDGTRDESFRMQRFLARWRIFEELRRRDLLGEESVGRFHCLGMTDGPNEIALLRDYHPHIWSWDSSSPVWHAINGIEYDNSPTGLHHGKFELEVDFDHPAPDTFDVLPRLAYNLAVVDQMCKGD